MSGAARRVVLVGNPNTGKSTLFGVLAGLHVRTANYPGVTIEKKLGRLAGVEPAVDLVDLPGTYSLSPRSPDELVAVEVLTGELPGEPQPDLIVCVVNATLLRRNLFLVSQLLELGRPLVVALNMIDAAEARGLVIDVAKLSAQLGVPVYPVSASRRRGVDELRQGMVAALGADLTESQQLLPSSFYHHRDEALARLQQDGDPTPSPFLVARAILDEGGQAARYIESRCGSEAVASLLQIRQRAVAELGPLSDMECDSRHRWAQRCTEGVILAPGAASHAATNRLDALLMHRLAGPLVFVAVMFLIFQFISAWSEVPMERVMAGQSWLAGQVEGVMSPGVLRSLLTDGIIAGVGSVVVFLPQIALLFLFLALLEDCGYMSRAAFMIDRLMGMFGLSGRSFLPLMSSFACAVPGIMATRVIENRRDRFATIFVAPLMSCSARLPVYLLLIGAFVPPVTYLGGSISLGGLILLAMYFVGVLVAIPTAWVLKATVLRGEPAPFVLELPEYKVPSMSVVCFRVWQSCRAFLVRAGTLIFAASILVWAAAYWPADHSERYRLQRAIEQPADDDGPRLAALDEALHRHSAEALERSLLGRLGHAIEPVVRPLGWDWKVGVGVLASFPAREVIIATLGTIYSLGGDVDEQDEGLRAALRSASWPDGRPVYTLPVALSIMVFFALCAQCASTLMVIGRETRSWRWPLASFLYMTTLAYFGALLTYQLAVRIV